MTAGAHIPLDRAKMNNRIKELAEQALRTVTAHGFSDDVYRSEGHMPFVSKAFADKFASLIIEECLSQCDKTISQYRKLRLTSDDFPEKNRYNTAENACECVKRNIKTGFQL